MDARAHLAQEALAGEPHEGRGQIAEGEERDGNQDGRPGLQIAEVAELDGQRLRPDALRAIEEQRDGLGVVLGLAQLPPCRRRRDLVDLHVIRLGEVDAELGGIIGEAHDAVAVFEVHGKDRP